MNVNQGESTGSPLGDLLRRERLRRRLTLAQVSQATRIHARLLEAIETDDYRALPAPVFAAGLIGTYARFLGVDAAPLVAAYKARAGDEGAPKVRPVSLGLNHHRTGLPSMIAPLLVAAFIVALGGYLYQQYTAFVAGASLIQVHPVVSGVAVIPTPQRRTALAVPVATPLPRTSPTRAAPTVAATAPPPTPTPLPLPTETPTLTPITGVHVDAQATARVWLQVEADNKIVFSGILLNGDRKSWAAQQKLMIWAGNAGSLNVTYNGKSQGTLGRPGEVVKVTWTATS